MGISARVLYVSLLAVFATVIVLAILIGLWIYAILAILFGGLFAYTAPFVFGKKWEPPEPTKPRRPVLRRRLR